MSYGYRDLMITLALEHEWRVGALLGLGSGTLLTRMLTEVPELFVVGVDHFVRRDRRERIMSVRREHRGSCVIYVARTSQASVLVDDQRFDFVFLDAARKYGCVRSDLRLWWAKTKVGGWFGGRAYGLEHPGVVAAVNDRFGARVRNLGYSIWSVTRTDEMT